jgi:uncharacterized LabA/DUF88 family protein
LAANFLAIKTMLSFAILIDGGFAKRKLGTAQAPGVAGDFERLIKRICDAPELANQRLHRVYYYDSTPLESTHEKPLKGGKVEFAREPVVARSKQLFTQLARLPMVAVRLGELTFNGWTVKAKKLERADGNTLEIEVTDLKPSISQKGVDMRIGMDIAALTLKKQVQTIVLVTGDSDFVPAMKFARREGCHLYLVPLRHHIRESMFEHTDLVLNIDIAPAA